MWYAAVCLNLVLALLIHSWHVGDSIGRYSNAAAAILGVAILVLQLLYIVESPMWLAQSASRRSRRCDEPHLCGWRQQHYRRDEVKRFNP